MFGRLKDWRRIATRYDRCAHTFFSAICIAATVIFPVMSPEPKTNDETTGFLMASSPAPMSSSATHGGAPRKNPADRAGAFALRACLRSDDCVLLLATPFGQWNSL